jgi:hypothetical protein
MKGWLKVKNQRLSHILITPTFCCAMTFFGVLFFLLIIFGALALSKANENADAEIRYDELW